MIWRPADRGVQPGCVFQTTAWHAVKGDSGRYRALSLHVQGRPVAHLALRALRVPGVFTRWTLLGEPIPLDQPIDQAAAFAALVRYARRKRVDLMDCWFNMARWPRDAIAASAISADTISADAITQDFGTYVVPLRPDRDALVAGMRKGHRRDYRRGLRDGVHVGAVTPADLADLLSETYAHGDKQAPFSLPYLRRLFDHPTLPVVTVGAWADERLVAAVVAPYDLRRGYYLHGGTRRPAPIGASIVAHVEAMHRLARLGVAAYDLGGCRPGATGRLGSIGDFKRRFNGAFEPVARWRLPLSRAGRAALAAQERWG